jgi:hypothetical protein
MHVGESAWWHRNGVECSCWLFLDLSQLALLAFLEHGCCIFAHTLPNKACRYHSFGSMYARVCHIVDASTMWHTHMAWKKAALLATGTSSLVVSCALSHSRLVPST